MCLERLKQVREAAQERESAYLFRTRLHRMVLSVQRLVVSEYGGTVKLPGELDSSPNNVLQNKELAGISTRIMQSSKYMSQRSVALDMRWESEWRTLRHDIDRMEQLLLQIADSAS